MENSDYFKHNLLTESFVSFKQTNEYASLSIFLFTHSKQH